MIGWPASSSASDAERFRREVDERLGQFGLKLHPDKTRLIEFGRFARENRRRKGQGKPRDLRLPGLHALLRQRPGRASSWCCGSPVPNACEPSSRRSRTNCRRRMHRPIAEQGKYLRAVVTGHGRYFGVPCNGRGCRTSASRSPGCGIARCAAAVRANRSDLEAHVSHRRPLAALPTNLPPLPGPASDRHDPRQEPYAVVPHVRICEGGVG